MAALETLTNNPYNDIKGVIHDFDGVVVDSSDFNKVFFPRLLRALDLEMPSEAEIMGCFHMTLRQTIETLTGTIDPAEIDDMVKIAHNLDRPIELLKFPRNQERTLMEFLNHGLVNVIATSAEDINVEEAYTRKPHLRELIAGHISIEDVTHPQEDGEDIINSKPHEEPLQKAAELANVPIENCVMIGDSETDVGAAYNAGIPAVQILFQRHVVKHEHAAASIHYYDEAPTAIKGIVAARARLC
jgi:beta-phosphoglucomutase-like phosphatase (HAD superfamily)